MTAFLIRRFLISLVVLALVSLISFFIITLTPGSPYPWGDLNPKISEGVKKAYQKKFHLDQPLHKQYWFIMRDMFTGKLVSNKDERPVLAKIGERVPYTLLLNAVALVIEFSFGIALGIYGARFRGTWRDKSTAVTAFAFIALPGFWISYLLCIFFVKYVQVPLLGLVTFGVQHANEWTYLLDRAWHLVLPVAVLTFGALAQVHRTLRANLLDALHAPFVAGARAKGLSERRVVRRHALRNALNPLITLFGIRLAELLSGAALVEIVFQYPGMGRLVLDATVSRDVFVVTGAVMLGALVLVAANLLADVALAWLDPRVESIGASA